VNDETRDDPRAEDRLIVLVLGVSGAGKNVALGALEDFGFATVNNLPCSLLYATVSALWASHARSIAIAVNAQESHFLDHFERALARLREQHGEQRLIVLRLDASDAVLVGRFAETRRRHPFADDQHTLLEAIRDERGRLAALSGRVYDIDTSASSPHALRQRVRSLLAALSERTESPLLIFSTFAYRNGIPQDADLVFDARVLPNPHYEPALRPLTGRDPPVADFLARQPETQSLLDSIITFLRSQLPGFARDNRARIHVAIGCTGGKHRSIYLAERLAEAFAPSHAISRHDREHPAAE